MPNTDINLLLTPVKPGKYLYHLTYNSYRESILLYGLDFNYNYKSNNSYYNESPLRTFAHNTEILTFDWYWLCLDQYDLGFNSGFDDLLLYSFNDRNFLRQYVNTFYDIWRIDTAKAERQWHVDYKGWGDNKDLPLDYYLFCYGNIPPEAIELCCLDLDDCKYEFWHKGTLCRSYYNPIIARGDFVAKHGLFPKMNFN